MTELEALKLIEDDKHFAAEALSQAIKDHSYFHESITNIVDLLKAHREVFSDEGFIEMALQCDDVINDTHNIKAVNKIKADAIREFKAHVKSGLVVLNEPSWQGKRKLEIDDESYFEIMLSEFDDYANELGKSE